MVQGRFLRLVHSVGTPGRDNPVREQVDGMQGSFLPSDDPRTLIFLEWDESSVGNLLDVFALSKPKVIFDLRVAPRFDIGPLTRKRFFELLSESNCKYIDVCGRMGVSNPNEALRNPVLVADYAGQFTAESAASNLGPFVFLHDHGAVDDEYVTALARALRVAKSSDWKVYRPEPPKRREKTDTPRIDQIIDAPISITRRLIFISHATPEDNAFVTWLASKLIAAGYQVWSDITDLNGGDVFWANIEEAIRLHAAKVIFVQSEKAKGKRNTRKEVYLALKVSERNRLQRFVVPIRIDSTPFDETIIELIDVQAIDCQGNWLAGLRGLLALFERDGVPRNSHFRSDQFYSLVASVNEPALKVIKSSERLISNWLDVLTPPPNINFFSCRGVDVGNLPIMAAKLGVPAFSYYKLLATPATRERLLDAMSFAGYDSVQISDRASLSWQQYLTAEYGDLPSWSVGEARYNVFGLLNRAWSLFMQAEGALSSALANERPFWFLADKRLPNNEVRFVSYGGKSVRRQLVGFSKKRGVFWHFGVQARAGQGKENFYYCLTPHVTFSADGRTVLQSKAQLHALRRSFCRSWWNNRWRDLLHGYVSFFSDGASNLKIDVGASGLMEVSSQFRTFASPVMPSLAGGDQTVSVLDEDEIEDPSDEDFEEEFDNDEFVSELSDVNSSEQ